MSFNINDSITVDILKYIEADSIRIDLDLDKTPKITDSKFGGIPYWDKVKQYPIDEQGNKLFLLAQINFEKSKLRKPFPEKGILQFFISKEQDYDFEKFKVVYHEDIDYSIMIKDLEEMEIPSSVDKIENYYPIPIHGEFSIDFIEEKSLMHINDDRFKKIVVNSIKKLLNKSSEEECEEEFEEYYDYLYEIQDETKTRKSRMLGYHFFKQCDERPDDYILLLQIDSEYNINSDNIVWGDDGVCNFFIKEEDLKNLNFENVVFYWDC